MVWIDKTIFSGKVVSFEGGLVLDGQTYLSTILGKHQHLTLTKSSECFVPIHHINNHRLFIFIFNFDQSALMLQVPSWAQRITNLNLRLLPFNVDPYLGLIDSVARRLETR